MYSKSSESDREDAPVPLHPIKESLVSVAMNALSDQHDILMGSENNENCGKTKLVMATFLAIGSVLAGVASLIEAIARLALAIVTSPLLLCSKKLGELPRKLLATAKFDAIIAMCSPLLAMEYLSRGEKAPQIEVKIGSKWNLRTIEEACGLGGASTSGEDSD